MTALTVNPVHTISPLTSRQIEQLLADLSQNRVANRTQGKQSLSYVEAWDIKATLIRVFGFGGFSTGLTESKILRAVEVAQSSGNGVNQKITAQATIQLYIHQLGAIYEETAIAGSAQPDWTEAADMAIKSAESDALKRAAVFLGTQFGLSLYSDGQLEDVVRTVIAPGQTLPERQLLALQRTKEDQRMLAMINDAATPEPSNKLDDTPTPPTPAQDQAGRDAVAGGFKK